VLQRRSSFDPAAVPRMVHVCLGQQRDGDVYTVIYNI